MNFPNADNFDGLVHSILPIRPEYRACTTTQKRKKQMSELKKTRRFETGVDFSKINQSN